MAQLRNENANRALYMCSNTMRNFLRSLSKRNSVHSVVWQ